MPNAPKHDFGEEVENDTRRDDHLEREFGDTGRDFVRGSDRNDEMFHTRMLRDGELFDARMADRRKMDGLAERRRERAEVQSDDRGGLEFRDAAIHSTAVGALEASTVVAAEDIQGEGGVAGAETEENTPDEDNANTPDKDNANTGVKA